MPPRLGLDRFLRGGGGIVPSINTPPFLFYFSKALSLVSICPPPYLFFYCLPLLSATLSCCLTTLLSTTLYPLLPHHLTLTAHTMISPPPAAPLIALSAANATTSPPPALVTLSLACHPRCHLLLLPCPPSTTRV